MPEKGKGKDNGKDKGKGKGKDRGKDMGDTSKSGYGKSSYGKDKSSTKSDPYPPTIRAPYQHGRDLIPPGDTGDWYHNEDRGFRQFWSNIRHDWIWGSWEEYH